MESSDSGGDDPEYEPSSDTARVLQDEFDEVLPKDVVVDSRRLKGHELTDFQLKYIWKAGCFRLSTPPPPNASLRDCIGLRIKPCMPWTPAVASCPSLGMPGR